MSERNHRLTNWDRNKAAHERKQFEASLYGEAGTTDLSDKARQRILEASEYEQHLERLAERSASESADLLQSLNDEPSPGYYREWDDAIAENETFDARRKITDTTENSEDEPPMPVAPGEHQRTSATSTNEENPDTSLADSSEISSRNESHDSDVAESIPERLRRRLRRVGAYIVERVRSAGSEGSQDLEEDEHYKQYTQYATVNADEFKLYRTLETGARIIDADEINSYVSAHEAQADERSVDKLLSHEEFLPRHGIEYDDKKFLFSDIVNDGQYIFSVCYHYDDERESMTPRLYYRSQSDGGWRVTPGILPDGKFSKGGGFHGTMPEYGQYVQATKPDENIIALLERVGARQGRGQTLPDDDISELYRNFSLGRAYAEGNLTFPDEVTFVKVEGEGMDAYVSGNDEDEKPSRREKKKRREALESMVLPDGFEPEFSRDNLVRVYTTKHTLIPGNVAVEVYGARYNDRDIEWHIARDGNERIWIDRIQFAEGEVTSYGTRAEVILAGALSAKPFDYKHEWEERTMATLDRDPDALPYNDTYMDRTPLLKKTGPLIRYQKAYGLL